jgi:adenosylcobinamide-phosphate synthase
VELAVLACALLLDVLMGEYPALLHPVVWIGKAISLLLRLAPASGWRRQLAFGAFLATAITSLVVAASIAALRLTAEVPWLQFIVAAFLLKSSFALRELGSAAARVRVAIERGDLPRAREALRSLCSRDPSQLDEESLLAATVQSLAENASDSFVAPLFFFLLLGVPGALAYRAINTLDAMVGYRGRYEWLGKAPARLDDVVNWLPARLTAVLFLCAGWLLRCDLRGGWRIFRRDGGNTPSPNGGRPMAMMAGLLGVKLEKKGAYALGDPSEPIEAGAVRRAWRVVAAAGWLMSVLCAGAIASIYFLSPK